MMKQSTIVGGIILAIVTGAATVFSERIFDVFIPKSDLASSSILIDPGQTFVKYPNAVELVARPNLRSWGKGKSSNALATSTRELVAKGLKLPVEMAAMEIHYQISNVAFGGQGRKRSASVEVALADREKGNIKCGPDTFAFRDDQELSQQIEKKLNAIVFQSFMGDKLSCG